MNDIPAWTAHVAAPLSRIVVAEPVDYGIPYWPEVFEQESFCRIDPNRDNYQITAVKFAQGEVVDLFD